MRQESGTEAERLAYDTTGLPVLSTWEVTSGSGQGNKYTWGGTAWVQTHSGGAALVNTQLSGPMHIREEDALGATAVTFEWPAPGITAVEITALSEAAPDGFSSIVLCIDPPTDALRDAWLTAGDNLMMDAQRLQLRANGEPMLIQFTAPVTKIGIKRDTGADALRVTAVGVGATA